MCAYRGDGLGSGGSGPRFAAACSCACRLRPPAPAPTPAPQPPADYPQQIRIKARILEWTHDSRIDWGFNLNYSAPDDSDGLRWAKLLLPSQHLGETNQGLEALLKGATTGHNVIFLRSYQTLEQLGDVRVISQPNIVAKCPPFGAPEATVAEGKYSAKVSTDSDVPYEIAKTAGFSLAQVTEYIKISTQLSVTVAGVKDKFIKLHVNASVNDLGNYVSVGKDTAGNALKVPRTEERSITNTILVADRQVFIAGLLKTAKNTRKSQGVPWLSELPLIGYLFKNQERTGKDQELLFIIQPRSCGLESPDDSERPYRAKTQPTFHSPWFLLALALAAGVWGSGCAARTASSPSMLPASSGEVIAALTTQTTSYDPSMMQVVLEAFAVEVNENKTHDIGVDSSFNRDSGNSLNHLEVDRLGSTFAPTQAAGCF
jgi:type II secretory pathway component GspD/PulD (secretin)